MTLPPPPGHQPPDQPVVIEPGFEVAVQSFWEKNRRLVIAACAAALLAIVAREAWQFHVKSREQSLQAEFARIEGRPEKLAAFASANPSHPLAGVAYLQLADGRYTAGDYRQAGENYRKAVGVLTNSILLGRAKIGAAMSQLNSGEQAPAEAALKAVAADASLPRAARAEAAYHLATLAHEAGNAGEVTRLVGEINQIDATGVWAQRVTTLLGPAASL